MADYVYRGTQFDAHLPFPYTPRNTRKSQAECGTRAGYKRHRTLGETICDGCRRANADYSRALRAKKVAA